MNSRISFFKIAPDAVKAQLGVEAFVMKSGLELRLIDLVRLRVSQINHCAYCIDMHWKDLRAAGETEQRLYGLDAWREAPYYTDRERAALAWAESVTSLTEGYVPDDVYETARAQFNERELVNLTMAVVSINSWNRLNVALRTEAGNYQPGQFKAVQQS